MEDEQEQSREGTKAGIPTSAGCGTYADRENARVPAMTALLMLAGCQARSSEGDAPPAPPKTLLRRLAPALAGPYHALPCSGLLQRGGGKSALNFLSMTLSKRLLPKEGAQRTARWRARHLDDGAC